MERKNKENLGEDAAIWTLVYWVVVQRSANHYWIWTYADLSYDYKVRFFQKALNLKYGGFQLVYLIITELKDHMTCYKF